mgnify:CR=1 FL=1
MGSVQFKVLHLGGIAGINDCTHIRLHTPVQNLVVQRDIDRLVLYHLPDGGDIGIALSQDKDALEKFRSKVSDQNFLLLDLEMAEHGITVKD